MFENAVLLFVIDAMIDSPATSLGLVARAMK
jgi:hypothetical protein